MLQGEELKRFLYRELTVEQVEQELAAQNAALASLGEDALLERTEIQNNISDLLKKIKKIKASKVGNVFDKIFRWTLWSIMIIYCISLIVLPVWMMLTSFKSAAEYATNKFALPETWYFRNYSEVVQRMKVYDDWGNVITVWDEVVNSILWAVGSPLFSTFLTTIVAYVMAKYKFPGRQFIYNLGILLMIIPIVGSLPAAMHVRKDIFGTYDNMFLTIITGPCAPFSGFNFLLLYGAFKSMPWDYAESVFLDGGGNFTALFKIYLPMILPTSTVIFVLGFLGAWNDYTTFMLWLPSSPNLAYGLYMLRANSQVSLSTPALMAGFTLIVIPTVILYAASQKLIMSRFNIGGLKG